jgi:hypothetical protein
MPGIIFFSDDDQSLKELGLQNPQRSAFGELMVAEKAFETGWNFFQDLDTQNVNQTVVGSGSASQGSALATISTGTTTGSTAELKTKKDVKYIPGTGIEAMFTSVFAVGSTGTFAEIGIGDDANGFFFQENAGTFGICRRQDSVDTFVAQASWNTDVMDGSGISEQTLDITKGNVYKIEYQWLGFGAINFYIEDAATGIQQLVHRIEYANSETVPSVFVPNLPLRAYVDNTTSTTDVLLKTSSAGAYTQGIPNTVRPGLIPTQITDDSILNPVAAVSVGKDPEGIYRAALIDGADEGNSSVALLGAGAAFVGDWRATEGYSAISISTRADQLSAVNGIYAQFADDELGTNLRTARVETYSADSLNKLAYYTWHGTLGKYARIVWTNGATPQTDFFLTSFLHTQATELPQSPLTSSLGGGTPSITTRSVLAGRLDDGSNAYDNVNVHQEQGFTSLAVGQGHRISQMFGRSHFEYNNGFTELTADTLLYTVPASTVLHVTSITLALSNQDNNNPGKVIVADSTTAGTGDVVFSAFVDEVSGGNQTSGNLTQTYPEPLRIENGLYFNEDSGIISCNLIITGYLEPV